MSKPIIYEPHPVSPERKAELVADGYQIIDAVFAPADKVELEADKVELEADKVEPEADKVEPEAPKPREPKSKKAEA